jgi:hypothetical protein
MKKPVDILLPNKKKRIEQDGLLTYNNLTMHQRINLKGMIYEERERRVLSHKLSKKNQYFDRLKALWLVFNFRASVEFFLNEETLNKI